MARTCRHRHPDLLHTTLLAFGDLAECPEEFLPELLKQLDGFRADAFHLHYDRIEEQMCVALRSGKLQRGAQQFREQIADYLIRQDFAFFHIPGKAHLTIRYGQDGKGDEPIAPIGWRVDEIILIESLGGKSTHIEHGRWKLDPLLV